MKKFLTLILISTIVLSTVGCGTATKNPVSTNTPGNTNKPGNTNHQTNNNTSTNTEVVDSPNEFIVGMRLGDAFDLTDYNEILDELVQNTDTQRDLKEILPFQSYTVVSDYGLVNEYTHIYAEELGTSELSIMSGSILGDTDSVMIVKKHDSDTYTFLIRSPYTFGVYNCTFKDLGNYKIVATDLSKEDVETMVLENNNYIEQEYMKQFDKQYRIASKEVDTIGEYIETQSNTARFFLHAGDAQGYVELAEHNLLTLADTNVVYVYFGPHDTPRPDENLISVETEFDFSVEGWFLSDVTEELINTPYDPPQNYSQYENDDSYLGEPATASEDILNEMLEMGYTEDMLDFSYEEWIDASNFPDDMCTDKGLLWTLSLINDELGGDLLSRGTKLTTEEILYEIQVESIPCTDIVYIMDAYKGNYCFIAKVYNPTRELEQENVAAMFDILRDYSYNGLQEYKRDAESQAKTDCLSITSAGPYVWMMCINENQSFDDYDEALSYHSKENRKLENRFFYLFDYLHFASEYHKQGLYDQ